MRLRTLGAVCASCAVAAPSSALAAGAVPAAAPLAAPLAAPPAAAAIRAAVMARLVNRHVFMKRRHVRLLGERLTLTERRALRARLFELTPAQVRGRTRSLRRAIHA